MASAGRAVVFQCMACRSLGSAYDFVVAADGTQAGLVCALCRFTSWLPISGHVDADAPGEASGGTPVTVTLEGARPSWPPASSAASPPPFSSTSSSSSAPLTPLLTTTTTDPSSPLLPSVALVPAPPRALQASFAPDIVERIHARLNLLPEPSVAQLPLVERFEKLLVSSWSSESEHKGLLKMAAMAGELALVGARYRAVLDVVRDEPRARAAQQELLTLAMATMQQSKELGSLGPGSLGSEAGTQKKTGQMVAAVLLIVGMLVGGVFFTRMIKSTFGQMEKIDR